MNEDIRKEFELLFLFRMSPQEQQRVLDALQEEIDKRRGIPPDIRQERVRMQHLGIEPPTLDGN